MDVIVTKVAAHDDDTLVVEGTVDGEPITAHGWVSAMDNHYPDDQRDEAGHRDEAAQPRPMTDDERVAYWHSLLAGSVRAPTVLFESETP